MNKEIRISDRKIEKIFNKCIILMSKGYDIDYCLNKFKKYKDVLEEYIRIYGKLKNLANLESDKNFIKNTLDKIYKLSAEKCETSIIKPPKRNFLFKPAIIFLITIVIIGFSFVGILLASQKSVPSEILYPVKRVVEQFKLYVYPESFMGLLHFDLLNNRLEETNKLIESNISNKKIADNLLSEIEYEYVQSKKYNYFGNQTREQVLNNINSIKSKYQEKYGQEYKEKNIKENKISNVNFEIAGPVYFEEQNIFYYRITVNFGKDNPDLIVDFNRDDSNGAWGQNVAQVNLNPDETFILTVAIPSLSISRSFTLVGTQGPVTTNLGTIPNPASVNNIVSITANVDGTTTGGSNIAHAEYSLDSGNNWVQLGATDGTFDEVIEDISGDFNVNTQGIYDLWVRGIDTKGNIGDPAISMLVVLDDPASGFVEGDGWINSPEGAYIADSSLTGKAIFSFESEYLNGDNIPMGSIEFQFETANLDLYSNTYDWLVLNQDGTFAQFKGHGTINDSEDCNFMLWVTDDTPVTFRVQIWTEDDGQQNIIYDNGIDKPINGGSIIVGDQ
jgi:hypothetical protein